MTRKSAIVTLCILGAVAATGACCCFTGILDDDQQNANKDGNPNHVVHHRGPRWFPWWHTTTFVGGPTAIGPHTGGGTSPGASSSPRGGFGATGHASGGGSSGGASSGAGS